MKGLSIRGVIRRLMVIFLLAFSPAFSLFAQAPPPAEVIDWHFTFGGRMVEFNEKKGKDMPIEACTINIYNGSTLVSTQSTGVSGKFKFDVPPNKDYIMTVTKPGYITKKISINTYNVPALRTEGAFAEFDVDIDLFKMYPGLDYSCLDKPIARIVYNPQPDVDDFDYDRVYTSQIQACIDNLKRLAEEARKRQKLYDDAIARADKAFSAKDWQGAKSTYQEALNIIATEQYPKDQIKKCDDEMNRLNGDKKKYDDAINAANALFAAADFVGAKAKYQEASGMRPAEQFPKDRIAACDLEIAKLAEKKKYDDAIAAADAKFNAKDYAGAKTLYQQASAMRAAEQYPKDQIKKCDDELNKGLLDKKYNDAIAAADALFKSSDWAGAKAKYQEASALKSAEQYPKDQIALCEANIAKAGIDKQYADLIKQADGKFDAKDYSGAKTIYVQAGGVKPAEQYPKDRIKLCDDNIGKAEIDKKYNDAIAAADALFKSGDWAGAKAKYQEASGIKSAEQYPKDQIKLCDENIQKAGKDKAYNDAIAAADLKFKAADWTGARAGYQSALAIKGTEQYPKGQIKLCDDNITKAGKDKAYADAIAAADIKFKAADWAGAKAGYQSALAIKGDEQYPKDQITICETNIAKQGIDKQYADAIKQADVKFKAADWAGAKTIYQSAAALKPNEQYPKEQIKLCDDNAGKAAIDKQYADLIKQADAKFLAKDYSAAKALYQQASGVKPDEQYPKDRMKLCDDNIGKGEIDKKYNDAIAAADALFKTSDWLGAKTKYQEAIAIKGDQQYPKDQIRKCDDNIAKQGVEKQFKDLITAADAKFAAKEWQAAKDIYVQAQALKPTDAYVKQQIKLCDDNIAAGVRDAQYQDLVKQADAKFDAKDWAGAKAVYQQCVAMKASDQYPKDRIKLCDENIKKEGADQKYKELIMQADDKFKAGDWAAAKALYQQASAIKTEEQYPKDQIALCDANAKGTIDKKYADAIAAADALFKSADWPNAKIKYQEASAIKPTEQYPKDQIKLCDKNIGQAGLDKRYNELLAQADDKFKAGDWAAAKTLYTQASGVKSTEQYPKDQIVICDTNIKAAKDKPYNDLIAQADDKFKGGDWVGAKTLYQQASALKTTEVYPKDQIKICDANISKNGLDKKYNDLIAAADAKFDAKDYSGAKTIYQQASAVKVAEQYPKDRIKACDDAIAGAGIDKRYNDAIAAADAKFNAKDWAGAKSKYQEASVIKSAEQYPKDRIKECDTNMANEKEQKYKDAIAQADAKFDAKDFAAAKVLYENATVMKPSEQYPKDRMKLCDEELAKLGVDKKYADLIKQADALFDAKNFAGAKPLYQQASAVKPKEQYPIDRILACDSGIKNAGIDKQYADLIKQADVKFNAKDYAGAKTIYQQASGVKPEEQYPKDRIKACDDAIAGAADKKYIDAIAAADVLFKASNWAGAKVKYQEALGMKPTMTYPQDQIRICDDNITAAGIDKQYNAIIADADLKFNSKNWSAAKAKYQEASALKPNEQYPKDRIAACEQELQNLMSADQKYDAAVRRGDSAMTVNDLETAQSAFTTAKGLKPAEAYPPKKLAEIAALLAGQKKENDYRNLVLRADSLMKADDLANAKKLYQSALLQKPADEYPKKKIAEIDRILSDRKFEEAKNAKYTKLIQQADAKFNAKDYKGAKSLYQQALQEKPLEIYPKKQIEACDNALNPKPVIKVDSAQIVGSDQYVSDLVKNYPPGVTEMQSKDAGADVTKRVVVVGNKGWVYTKKVYSWGTFYFKDSQQITAATFDYETNAQYVARQNDEYNRTHPK